MSQSLGPISASPQYAVDAAVRLLNVGPNDVVFDLGCNDGAFIHGAILCC